jgi:OOP family OmpA-OmpF porin
MKFRFSLLSAMVVSSLALSATAMAQDASYDDRWYITAGAGANIQDSSRDTENSATYTLGVGKFVNPRWSVDAELNYQNPKTNRNEDLNWSQYGISIDARRHWRQEGRSWNPYALMGVGYQRAEEEYEAIDASGPRERKDGYPSAKLGFGVQGDFERVSLRGELYARADFDRDSVSSSDNRFIDGVAQVSLVVPLGTRVAQVTPPTEAPIVDVAPQPPVYEQPAAPATLELQSAYFAFDKSDLTADGRRALDEAANALKQNSAIRARVTGHTDSVGSEHYNQGLSERRAQVAYDYLVQQGVNPAQLEGPVGYGESRPAADNGTAEGRAKNRRADVEPANQ